MNPPPTFQGLPIRPVLCGLAAFGAVRNFTQFMVSRELDLKIEYAIVFLFDVFLFIGAIRNSLFALKWSLRVVISCIIISTLRFLIYPIIFSSLMASGVSNATNLVFSEIEIEANITSPEQHFVLGMVTGFTLEVATAISVFVEFWKYVLVLSLWKYAKAVEMGQDQKISMP